MIVHCRVIIAYGLWIPTVATFYRNIGSMGTTLGYLAIHLPQPIGSMYGIYVGEYTIHGSYG